MDISRTFDSLRPNAKFTDNMSNAFSLETLAKTFIGTMPTQAEMDAEWDKLQAYDTTNEYKGLRAKAYPSLTEQADMAYWDRQNGTTTLDDAISAVKLQFPKG